LIYIKFIPEWFINFRFRVILKNNALAVQVKEASTLFLPEQARLNKYNIVLYYIIIAD